MREINLTLEVNGIAVVVSGRSKTMPFTTNEKQYLQEYVERNLQGRRDEFTRSHSCSKCYKPGMDRTAHVEQEFRSELQAGKVFVI